MSSSSSVPSYQSRIDCGTKLSSISPPYFTCQSYNLKENFFGYRGVPTSRTELLLEKIADAYEVLIMVVLQATHTFDVKGYDALLHSAQKRKLRSYPGPLCTDHIVRDWNRACDEVCHSRTIQTVFYAGASTKYGGRYL